MEIQNTLAELIIDFIYTTSLVSGQSGKQLDIPDDIIAEFRHYITPDAVNTIPHYVRVLFRHYCLTNDTPRFEGIEKVRRSSMSPKLSKLILSTKARGTSGDWAQISSTATSKALSDRNSYPTFYRTVPSDAIQARGIINLCLIFQWNSIGVIHVNELSPQK